MVKADILTRVKQITSRTNLTSIDNELFAALKEMAVRTMGLKTSATGSTTANTSYISRPADMLGNFLDGMVLDGVAQEVITFDEYLKDINVGYVVRDYIYIRPTPAAVYTYTLYYTRQASSSDIDSIPFNDVYQEALCYLTSARVYEQYEIFDRAAEVRALYENEMRRFDGLEQSIPAVTNTRRNIIRG